jgi:hypothetical protein
VLPAPCDPVAVASVVPPTAVASKTEAVVGDEFADPAVTVLVSTPYDSQNEKSKLWAFAASVASHEVSMQL